MKRQRTPAAAASALQSPAVLYWYVRLYAHAVRALKVSQKTDHHSKRKPEGVSMAAARRRRVCACVRHAQSVRFASARTAQHAAVRQLSLALQARRGVQEPASSQVVEHVDVQPARESPVSNYHTTRRSATSRATPSTPAALLGTHICSASHVARAAGLGSCGCSAACICATCPQSVARASLREARAAPGLRRRRAVLDVLARRKCLGSAHEDRHASRRNARARERKCPCKSRNRECLPTA